MNFINFKRHKTIESFWKKAVGKFSLTHGNCLMPKASDIKFILKFNGDSATVAASPKSFIGGIKLQKPSSCD